MFASYEEADNVFGDYCRTWSVGSFIYAAMTILVILMLSSAPLVQASQELGVFRMQEYDYAGIPHGCRNSIMNLEARTVQHSAAQAFTRKCLMVKLLELVERKGLFEELTGVAGAAGILVLLPRSFNELSAEHRGAIMALEKAMLSETVQIPVYFAYESPELQYIYDEIATSSSSSSKDQKPVSTARRLFNAVVANGYQMVVSGNQAAPIKGTIMTAIEAKLVGNGIEDELPTVAITAHYDTFGIAPGLAFGADSNGSGVVALLELLRIFAKLYSNPATHPPFNLIFLLSPAGKFGFYGAKKWIEEHLDNSESSLLLDSLFTICLDSIADMGDERHLHMHVSKPPKEGSPAAKFYAGLQLMSSLQSVNVSMTHKKINLADDRLAWEHERFSIRRLPAFTISSLNSHKLMSRSSITDSLDRISPYSLTRNIKIVGESLARQVYSYKDRSVDGTSSLFTSELSPSNNLIESYLAMLCSDSRAQQLLMSRERSGKYTLPPLLSSLESIVRKHTKHVQLHHFKVDKKEPEMVFYSPLLSTLVAYNIKPAVFDLFLCLAILIYLGAMYLFIINFHYIRSFVKLLKCRATRSQNGHVANKGK